MRLNTSDNFSKPYKALQKFCELAIGDVLNIGDVRESPHTQEIEKWADVTTISLRSGADVRGDYLSHKFKCGLLAKKFDGIWCAHCLEHQRNPGAFLEKIFSDLKDGGILCVTVPPHKDSIVGGHVTLWNGGLLLYNLVLAGFDCSEARLLKDGYNISVLVEKRRADLPELNMDSGDIEKLAQFFPMPVQQGFDGNIGEIAWHSR
jgi:SAM-dependent methyltransferase